MNRFLHLLRKTAIVLAALMPLLGLAAFVWHRRHYQLPPPRPLFVRYNTSLRFDLLDQAAKAIVPPIDPKRLLPDRREIPPSRTARIHLARANAAALRGLRLALEAAPPRPAPRIPSPRLDALVWVATLTAQVHAEAGDLPEATRCALDAVELTARSGLLSRQQALRSERSTPALSLLWKRGDRLDAASARRAVRRLERIERLRWTREDELRDGRDDHEFSTRRSQQERPGLPGFWQRTDHLPCTRRPLYILDWGNCLDREPRHATLWEKADWLWRRARLTFDGPGGQVARARRWTEQALAQERRPWSPHTPAPPAESVWLLNQLDDSEDWRRVAAEYALLRTRLGLHAYRKERGRYPESLTALTREGYLAALPVDPFSFARSPLRYHPDLRGRMRLYSVGPDGKDSLGTGDGDDLLAQASGE